jgi:hypothetical protein
MIGRIWHGWTHPANADAYEELLKSEIFTGIQDRHIYQLSWQRDKPAGFGLQSQEGKGPFEWILPG